VVGTSAGALVASMYACGYSPDEIEAYVLSEPFQLMVKGDVEVQKNSTFLMSPIRAACSISLFQRIVFCRSPFRCPL
jgi:predicted acylesterase/phospholipase RssA